MKDVGLDYQTNQMGHSVANSLSSSHLLSFDLCCVHAKLWRCQNLTFKHRHVGVKTLQRHLGVEQFGRKKRSSPNAFCIDQLFVSFFLINDNYLLSTTML